MAIGALFIVFSPFLVFIPQIIALYRLIRNRSLNLGNSWTAGTLLLFFWSLVVGLINTQFYSFVTGFVFLGFYAMNLYLHQNYPKEKQIENLLYYIFSLTLISALFGLLENIGLINHNPAWWKYCFGLTPVVFNDENIFRITGTFGNSNLAATWYAVMILVGLYFYEKSWGRQRNILFFGIILLIIVLVMTGSRGAIIGLLVGLVVYDFAAARTFQFIVRILFFMLALTVFFGYSQWFPRGDLLSSTIDLRWAIWENCLNMFLMKPVTGWGIMGIYYADNNVYQYLHVLHAHNMLISWGVMLGVVGLLILFWMVGCLIVQLWQLFKEKCPLLPLLVGVQAVFWGHGVFDFTIMSPQIGLLFFTFSSFIATLAGSQIPLSQFWVGRQISSQ